MEQEYLAPIMVIMELFLRLVHIVLHLVVELEDMVMLVSVMEVQVVMALAVILIFKVVLEVEVVMETQYITQVVTVVIPFLLEEVRVLQHNTTFLMYKMVF